MSFSDEPTFDCYESAFLAGAAETMAIVRRKDEECSRKIAALRALVREARQQVFDVIDALPLEERGKFAGVVQILTTLATREVL